MAAVEAVLQVDLGVSYEIVTPHQVVVVDQNGQQGLLRKRRLDLK